MLGRVVMAMVAAGILLTAACGGDDAKADDVVITWTFDSMSAPWEGAVTLTGGAVDDGVVCAEATGVESDFSELEADEDSLTLRLEMRLMCADGSGDFVIQDDATLAVVDDVPVQEDVTGSWTVISGTGDYGELTGSGDSTNEGLDVTTKTYTGTVSVG